MLAALCSAALSLVVLPLSVAVAGEGFGTVWYANPNPGFGDEGRAAPASVAMDVPVVYEDHWDVPSRSGNPALVGPVQFLRRAIINEDDGTITLPLYPGHNADGTTVWYVLTETTNKEISEQMGLTFSAKLRYADKFGTVRAATLDQNAAFVFQNGTVDFTPVWSITPGSTTPYPLAAYQPGSVADRYYSPIVRTPDNVYYNAPVVAFNVSAAVLQQWAGGNPDYSVVHDKVIAINPANYTVTLDMTNGFAWNKPIFYLSTDASDPVVAAIEKATWAPALVGVNQTDRDIDSIPGQGNERLGLIVNGPVNPFPGTVHPYRQGLYSAVLGQGDPLNVSRPHRTARVLACTSKPCHICGASHHAVLSVLCAAYRCSAASPPSTWTTRRCGTWSSFSGRRARWTAATCRASHPSCPTCSRTKPRGSLRRTAAVPSSAAASSSTAPRWHDSCEQRTAALPRGEEDRRERCGEGNE